jgi:hypothetical protein
MELNKEDQNRMSEAPLPQGEVCVKRQFGLPHDATLGKAWNINSSQRVAMQQHS